MTATGGPVAPGEESVRLAPHPTFALLDGLRAVAALGVFLYHLDHEAALPGVLHVLASHGNAGVPLFFVLSGFLLYRPLVVRRSSGNQLQIRRFYARRAARILPAYWVELSLVALTLGVSRFTDRWWQLYLLGQGFDPDTTFAGIGPAWSLAIEASFYLLLPLYAVAIGSRVAVGTEIAVIASLAVASVGFHEWVGTTQVATLGYTLPGTFYLFAAGMSLAVLHARTTFIESLARTMRAPALLWAVAAIIFVGASIAIPAATLGSVHPLYGMISVFIFLPAIMPGRVAAMVLSRPLLAGLGTVSYAFYLWHHAIIELVGRLTSQWWLIGLVAFGLTALVAITSYWAIERPVMRWARRGERPGSSTPHTPGSSSVRASPGKAASP